MTARAHPIRSGWVVVNDVPGPDVDEFAEPEQVVGALARPGAGSTLLAVQHPHRTPLALSARAELTEALPAARAALAVLLRTAYRPVREVAALYQVDGRDGSLVGVLCMVDPAAVHDSEDVFPEVVLERAAVLDGLGYATSAALLVPVGGGQELTELVQLRIGGAGPADVSTVDSAGRRHRVWLLTGPERDEVLAAAGAHPLMVADGNHRVAAAAAAGLDGLLAVVAAGPALRIGAFHRAISGTGLDADALLDAWRRVGVEVCDGIDEPAPGRVVVHCGQRRLVVTLPEPRDEPLPRIDHAVVENLLLHKALGLDPEGPRVLTLPDGRPIPSDVDAVLMVAPVPVNDVLAVHRAGRRMPRKSTYFTPKPRSGLLVADLRG